jgi:colanic acid/amylovoran biosynthesis glycosyltransferase
MVLKEQWLTMRPTKNIIGKTGTILAIVSASATHPSSFVLREIRQFCQQGLTTYVGQIRPVFRKMDTKGFGDIASCIAKPIWVLLPFATIYWAKRNRAVISEYLKSVFISRIRSCDLVKMLYILVASMVLAYQHRKSAINHVHAHFLHTESLSAYLVGRLLEIPYSLTVHTIATHFPVSVLRCVLKETSFVVADTWQVADFVQAFGVEKERIHLIRNGVPTDELAFRSAQAPSVRPIVLAIGYLSSKKGFGDLITACGFLRDRKIPFQCVLIGDGSERGNLEKLRKELKLEKEVEMIGNVNIDALRGWYYQATVFVMPSVVPSDKSTDGLPTVVIEALACGIPVIGTTTAAIPEIIFDGETGFLVPPFAPHLIAERIELLLSHPSLRTSLSLKGRQLVENEFDLHRNSEMLTDLIFSHTNYQQQSVLVQTI